MNTNMFYNPATQRNINQLKQDGHQVMFPDKGFLAEGYEGVGRLPELTAIISELEKLVAQNELTQLLKDKKVVISAGGTRERIDPVRYITNDSSGKMGYALAEAAVHLGAKVTLVSTVRNLIVPTGVDIQYVESAQSLFKVMQQALKDHDIAIMTAAVSDYRVKKQVSQKIKKQAKQEGLTLELVENPDILAYLGQHKQPGQIVIGFAAETHNVFEFAKGKLERKKADWIVANDVSRSDAGFSSDHNQVTLLGNDDRVIPLEYGTKKELAYQIWQAIMG